MNRIFVVGVVLLIVAVVYFLLAPAFMTSDGRAVVLWGNILPGIVLAVLGIALLVMSLRGKKGSASARAGPTMSGVGETKYCMRCGASMLAGASFCDKCGAKQS